MVQSLKEAVLVAMGVEHWVVDGLGIKLLHVHQPILWQDGFHPHSADVVTATGDQHVGYWTSEQHKQKNHFIRMQYIFLNTMLSVSIQALLLNNLKGIG